MPGQNDNIVPFPDAQPPGGGGNGGGGGGNGGGGDKYLYEKVGKLEGQISGLATKEDVQKIKTEIANSIGEAKSWFFLRLSIVLTSALLLVGGGLFAFFKWSFGPFLENLLKNFSGPPGI